ncbi:hypothetical protein [Thermomonospora cellulosilytica]|uniref:Uncharacterized protein n=1 Tax=Thermomonospora cellulosilytica TaxID=1411118 RepID=A0A7W3N4V3_9ACTN|nr:hypothetical protein [Thermomonospora cellulosilytica]MBA9007540.1 hypothetical protein [Thermomonospora cellulosilytica]
MSTPEAPPTPLPEDPEPSDRPERPERRRGRLPAAALAVLGVAALVGGATGLGLELTRTPTQSEIKAAGDRELALRWRFLTAGEIFPATVRYGNGAEGKVVPGEKPKTARRVGIAPAEDCAKALDPAPAKLLVQHGCRTVLVATYVDDSLTQVATVGVAVMPGSAQTLAFISALNGQGGPASGQGTGLRAQGFIGTPADRFLDSGRQEFGMRADLSFRYVIFMTAGWGDGRGRVAAAQVPPEFMFAHAVLERLRTRFAEVDDPCGQEGVSC